MNANYVRCSRGLAIALLLAAGVVTTLATGGGGGGGFEPIERGPTLPITAVNGKEVASTLITAIGTSFDLGDIPGEELPIPIAGMPLVGPGSGDPSSLLSKLQTGELMAVMSCPSGGTVDITVTATDPDVPSVGDRIVAVFESCGDLDNVVMTGTVDLTIAAVEGDTSSGFYLLGIDVLLVDIVMSDNTDTVTANADFTLTLDRRSYPVYKMTMAGAELEFGSGGETITLTDFDHHASFDETISLAAISAGVSGRLESSTLNGSVDYVTLAMIEVAGENDPHDGLLRISGANDTSLRIVIVDATQVILEIDESGDGVIDEYVYTSWAELTGQSSSGGDTAIINSSTAPIVAREAYNAIKGFGSVSVIAGLQFAPNGVFRMIEPLGLTGDFGPIEVICPISGTAILSGTRAAADTFSTGDVLNAHYAECARGNGTLNGGLAFTVGSFDENTLDAVFVTGAAVETDLKRTVDNCFRGNGTFDVMVDWRFTSPPVIFASSTAASFTVDAAGRSQQLAGATVNTQIDIGQGVTIVRRDSSGRFTSADVEGVMTYRSIVPDEFVLDTSIETGPYSGELLVTASDGSALRLVAVSDSTVRLDIDLNGDSVTDHQITSTWAELLEYGGWLCGPTW